MSCNFCLFFNFFVPKTYVFENSRWGIIPLDFVGFPFRTSISKNEFVTLNITFHIYLGRFVGD